MAILMGVLSQRVAWQNAVAETTLRAAIYERTTAAHPSCARPSLQTDLSRISRITLPPSFLSPINGPSNDWLKCAPIFAPSKNKVRVARLSNPASNFVTFNALFRATHLSILFNFVLSISLNSIQLWSEYRRCVVIEKMIFQNNQWFRRN